MLDISKIMERHSRARSLAMNGGVESVLGDDAFVVQSQTGQGAYVVFGNKCSCPDAKYRVGVHGGLCKHLQATHMI